MTTSAEIAAQRKDAKPLLDNFTVEVMARDEKSVGLAPTLFKPGTEVFIAWIPGDTSEKLIESAISLKKAGLTPVPHIVARNITGPAMLDELLATLTGEAGIDRVLTLAGDRDKPEGEFTSSLDLIQTGLFPKHGIRNLGIAAHPEGHARVDDATVFKFLQGKLDAAKEQGLNLRFMSQFAFESAPTLALVRRFRSMGIDLPYRVGVAGPAGTLQLIKYAALCGVGNSINVLKKKSGMTADLLTREDPLELMSEIGREIEKEPSLNIVGSHFFVFGGLKKTAEWINENQV